jgi:hypothetical protein
MQAKTPGARFGNPVKKYNVLIQLLPVLYKVTYHMDKLFLVPQLPKASQL